MIPRSIVPSNREKEHDMIKSLFASVAVAALACATPAFAGGGPAVGGHMFGGMHSHGSPGGSPGGHMHFSGLHSASPGNVHMSSNRGDTQGPPPGSTGDTQGPPPSGGGTQGPPPSIGHHHNG